MKILLKDGHIVYGGARRAEKMDLIKQAGAKVLSLDVTNDDAMGRLHHDGNKKRGEN